jgi:DNA-binding MarR family transcriptional regulator
MSTPGGRGAGSGGAPRKRKKTETPPAGGAAAAAAAAQIEMAAAQIIKVCSAQEGGVASQKMLEEACSSLPQDLMLGALNRLMSQGRVISMVGRANAKLSFKLQSAEEAAKVAGLTAEDHLVKQEVERASTAGISTKDLKTRTNLQTQQLARVLKKLETRKIVQHVKSVASKNKKMYLLYGLEPTVRALRPACQCAGNSLAARARPTKTDP